MFWKTAINPPVRSPSARCVSRLLWPLLPASQERLCVLNRSVCDPLGFGSGSGDVSLLADFRSHYMHVNLPRQFIEIIHYRGPPIPERLPDAKRRSSAALDLIGPSTPNLFRSNAATYSVERFPFPVMPLLNHATMLAVIHQVT